MQSSAVAQKHPRLFYGWYIVGASILMNFYLSISFFQGFQVFFLPILNEFSWSRALTSGAFSLRQLETGILAPVAGFLVDRWGPRTIILLGVFFGGLGMVMMSFINSVWSFYLAFAILSLGTTGASHGVSWVIAVGNWFRRLRGRALGIAMLGPVVAGPFVVTVALMEEALGWRKAVLLLGIGIWIVGFPLAMVARSRPEAYGAHPDGDVPKETQSGNAAPQAAIQSAESQGFTARQAIATRVFWALSIIFGVNFIASGGLTVHLIPLLEGLKYTPAQAATILGMVFLASGIGRIGAGMLLDRFDCRAVIAGLMASQIVGLWVLTLMSHVSLWQVSLFLLFFGVGFGGSVPLRPFLVRQFFGARSFGGLQGLVQGVGVGLGVVGPVFYGRVFDVSGSYNFALYATMGLIAIATPLVFMLGQPSKE
ncbi:MAG: MFS transporter [Chloroflexi bacterium]|nr:MFS transporter [Chloroflexota bacterium]